jgi:hypothetical protein
VVICSLNPHIFKVLWSVTTEISVELIFIDTVSYLGGLIDDIENPSDDLVIPDNITDVEQHEW